MAIAPLIKLHDSVDGKVKDAEDSSRTQTAAENVAGVNPSNYSYRPYTSKRYGIVANNTADDSGRLQGMLSAAEIAGDTGSAAQAVIEADGRSTIRCDSGLTYDPSRVCLDGQGCTLNFEHKTTGAFAGIKMSTRQQSGPLGGLQHNARPLRNLVIQMPAHTVNADGYGLYLVDETDDGSGNYTAPAMRIENVSIHGGAYGLVFGNGAWGAVITGLSITQQGGNTVGNAIYAPSPWTDGRSPPHIIGGTITNGAGAAVFLEVGSLKLTQVSFDGYETYSVQQGTGTVTFNQCYFEFSEGDNSDAKFRVEDANAVLEIVNCEFSVRGDVLPARTVSFITSDDGDIVLRDLTFENGAPGAWYQANGGFLCALAGSARVHASGLIYKGFSYAPLVARTLQWLAYPDFDNANALAALTLSNSGATNPVRVTGVSGRDVIRFQINNGASSGSFSRAVLTHDVVPGKRISVVGDYSGDLSGSNTTAEVTFTYKDKAGNTISTAGPGTLGNTNAGFTQTGADGGYVPAGAETVDVQIQLRATGTSVGTTQYHLSPLGIGYADGE
jgi:hypothetical protein